MRCKPVFALLRSFLLRVRCRNNLALITLFLYFNHANAQQSDVTFFVIGKHGNYVQSPSGQHEVEDFSFFSEIFLTSNGDATGASLRFPTNEIVDYRDMRKATGGDRYNILLIPGEVRPKTYADLLDRYPDGNYRFSFSTPSGSVSNGLLSFENRPLPKPPQISVQQGGVKQCAVMAPGSNAVVRWSDFEEGRADPNEILDDLVFVILTDADGNRVAHSGRPFENRPYLTYASENFVIDGDLLRPDQTYTLSVEHALLDDTTRFDSVPAFTTRAVTSKFILRTGPPDQEMCMPMTTTPSLSSQVTMFYYKDLEPAAYFYGDLLGLEKTLDLTWVKFYKTGPASTVGLVMEGDGGWHKVQEKNSVMLSLVTEEVDAWYERLKDKQDLTFLKEIGDGGPVRSFLLADPGGYTVEFFEWLEAPE